MEIGSIFLHLGFNFKFTMKAIKTFAAIALISGSVFSGLTSFTASSADNSSAERMKGNIEFKIVNNSGADWKYCANGGHNTISKGTTKTMSYSEGTELKYIDKGNCGGSWLKVSSSMNGKTYKLSELMN